VDSTLRFEIKRPDIICEEFDDEIVIINVESGNYYSVSNVGAAVWDLIQRGSTLGEIVAGIAQRYSGSDVEIKNAINQFMTELQHEELVAPDSRSLPTDTAQGDPQIESESNSGTAQFEAPVLQKYTDMRDLLLLDPIHEVDETGWPKRNTSG
jgi:hypothetical protein